MMVTLGVLKPCLCLRPLTGKSSFDRLLDFYFLKQTRQTRNLAIAWKTKERHKHSRNGLFMPLLLGGDDEDRTHDLTDANRTLSQLSYAPKCKI